MSVILLDRISQPNKRRSQIDGREIVKDLLPHSSQSGPLGDASNIFSDVYAATLRPWHSSEWMSQSGTPARKFLWSNGTPEGSLSAGPGSLCCDDTNGRLYVKVTGTGNTGWKKVSTDDSLQKISKIADESVTSSTTLQDDNHLMLPVGANENWVWHMFLQVVSASETPDFSVNVTAPSGATGWYGISAPAATLTNPVLSDVGMASRPYGTGLANFGIDNSVPSFMILAGFCDTAGTAGNVTLQWAQGVSDANSVTVKLGSFMIGHRLD